MKNLTQYFEARKAYGSIFIRLIIGWRLIAGVYPYATHLKPMSEVSDFFTGLNLPIPLPSAYLSVYAQFVCGILFIIGLWVRTAAIAMLINFLIAIAAAHLHDGIERSFAAWIIFAASVFFLFNGAGKISVDDSLHNRHTNEIIAR